MTEAFNQHEEDDPLEKMRDLTAQWANYFNGIQQVLDDYERLQKRVAALESENAALTDTVEQWKNNDEWSNRVTYDNVVDQIASLEDASKRDDARRLIEALLKKSQVTQFRRDIKHRVKELNEEGDAYSDKQVVQVLEACAGKGLVIDAKWKWAGAYWLLRWACNIRKICTLSFMDYDPRRMDSVRVSKNDQGMFSQCREIVLRLVDEFGKTSLPQE